MTTHVATLAGLYVAAAASIVTLPAAAQRDAAETAAGWITVVAPHVERAVIAHNGSTSGTEVVTITHRVEYADLDLTMYSDVKELERRIGDKAKVACEQLAVLYPIAKESITSCVQGSVSGAMEQAKKAIDAANAKR